MQWLMLLFWLSLTLLAARTKVRAAVMRILLTFALILSMLCQLFLLSLDNQLTLATALPLHICGLMGVLSVPLLWFSPVWLLECSLFLGAPCALMALCFPAVIQSSQPTLMFLSFCRLHVLIVCTPFLLLAQGKPLPTNPRRTFIIGNCYLLVVSIFNRLFSTNYLFLRNAPLGTPLSPLFARGGMFYVSALEMLCMLVMLWLAVSYKWLSTTHAVSLLTVKNT